MASLTFILRSENLNGRLRSDLLEDGGAVQRDVQRRTRQVRDRARALAADRSRASTGRLPASIRYRTERRGDGWAGQAGSDLAHAVWTEKGSGVYGPTGRPIVPTRGKYLAVPLGGGGRVVFLTSVLGQRPKHYLRDALPAFRE